MDERQSLETLARDEKTAGRTLAQLKDKLEQFTQKREKLEEERRTQEQKKSDVRILLSAVVYVLNVSHVVGR